MTKLFELQPGQRFIADLYSPDNSKKVYPVTATLKFIVGKIASIQADGFYGPRYIDYDLDVEVIDA